MTYKQRNDRYIGDLEPVSAKQEKHVNKNSYMASDEEISMWDKVDDPKESRPKTIKDDSPLKDTKELPKLSTQKQLKTKVVKQSNDDEIAEIIKNDMAKHEKMDALLNHLYPFARPIYHSPKDQGDAKEWLNWDGYKWDRLLTNDMINAIQQIYQNSEKLDAFGNQNISQVATQGIKAFSASKWSHRAFANELEISTESLPFSNKHRSINLRALDEESVIIDTPQSELMTQSIDVSSLEVKPFNSIANSEWMKDLKSWFPKDEEQQYIDALQLALGQSLAGNPAQIFLLQYGLGGDGKSSMSNAMAVIFGEFYNKIAASTFIGENKADQRNAHTTDLGALMNKRIVSTMEASTNTKTALIMSSLKDNCGGETISWRKAHGDEDRKFESLCMPIMNVNHKPKIDVIDMSVIRRMVVIKYSTHQKGSGDRPLMSSRDLKKRFSDNKGYILSWILEGLVKWNNHCKETGELSLPKFPLIEKQRNDYISDEDEFGYIFDENFVNMKNDEYSVSINDVKHVLNCNGCFISNKQIGIELEKRYTDCYYQCKNTRKKVLHGFTSKTQ